MLCLPLIIPKAQWYFKAVKLQRDECRQSEDGDDCTAVTPGIAAEQCHSAFGVNSEPLSETVVSPLTNRAIP